MDVVNDDEDIIAFGQYEVLVRKGASSRLVISCSGVGGVAANTMGFEWRASFIKLEGGYSYIFIKDLQRSWFNNAEFFDELVSYLNSFIEENSVDDISIMGLSMGAYGALVLSQHVPCSRVYAMSARSCVDEAGRFDGRNRQLIEKIQPGPHNSMVSKEVKGVDYFYVFSVDEYYDVRHAELLANGAIGNVKFIAYHGDHNTGITLIRSGLREDFVESLVRGRLDIEKFQALGFSVVNAEEISFLRRVFEGEEEQRPDLGVWKKGLLPVMTSSILRDGLKARFGLISTGCAAGPNNLRRYLTEGWSFKESKGTWTLGDRHVLAFSLIDYHDVKTLRINLSFRAMVTVNKNIQRVTINCGNKRVFYKCVNLDSKFFNAVFEVPAASEIELEILTPDAVSPKDLGINGDARALALQLQSIRLDRRFS